MVKAPESSDENSETGADIVPPNHPGFGFMKGMLIISPGTDLTAPAYPDWGSYAEQKYGPDSELGKLLAAALGHANRGE